MEHTVTEPFDVFMAQNNSDAQSVRDIEKNLAPFLPSDSDFKLFVPVTSFDGQGKSAIAEIKRALIEAVCAAAPGLPIVPVNWRSEKSRSSTGSAPRRWRLRKSRARREDDPTIGRYHLVDDRNVVVFGYGPHEFDATLDTCLWALTQD
jgi:hypothetical protein